ncbi:hypothetical protein PFICI_14442 [Pestalotiopsis fici W106-1]|uniref:Glycosyl hydrolases family 2 sugar binding domain-containing protein n=1 Tax=Pestalotiopsis fici (strain W106-1 / CGMCC3.15140) TaxID=1229662 RepID=W3WL05_PESFW|nr:uncharacterized protein PFICI_14442 [Pestalotiopsis fici W106-1]ETS73496.1 hypothetical protein PFICI_14442 [Pestalotiopsis fici W106-1]
MVASAVVSLLGASSQFSAFLEGFASPPTTDRPYIRWWWPHGVVDPDEIRAEVVQIAEAGFGGFEIEDVHHSLAEGIDYESTTHGWGSEPWLTAFTAALEEANKLGLGHDTAFGPSWPMGSQSIGADDDAAAKEIVFGKSFVTASTFAGPVPPPFSNPKGNVTIQTLVAVQAWRLDQRSNSTSNPVYLEYGSMMDLTASVVDGKIEFDPPDNSTWLIYSAFVRGTGQQPEDYPHTNSATYVVDHFGTLGCNSVLDYWDVNILAAEVQSLLAVGPTALFEDSLEMVSANYWTTNYMKEFEQRRGYDIRTVLPIVTKYKNNAYLFLFPDDAVREGALHDYADTLSDLYQDYHVKPIKKWLGDRGLLYRAQVYGILGLDSMRLATGLDIPEGESLGFKVLDQYRTLAGATNMAGLNVLSNELGAYSKGAYATSWRKILGTVNPEFAAGVTRNVLHGFSYIRGPNATWPGWAAFTPINGVVGYSESWGPRHPTWLHAGDFTGYLGRTQYFARMGVAKYDCAFFRQNGHAQDSYVGPYFTSDGANLGWTTTYVDYGVLNLPKATVSGQRLAPGAGNYSVLAVDGDALAGYAPTLTVGTASLLEHYAESGLPILLIGNWSSPRPFGLGSINSTSVATFIKKMLKLDNVANVDRNDIASGLAQLGVSPATQYESSHLTHIKREFDAFDMYYFVCNSSSEVVQQTVSVPIRSSLVAPVQLDPWTGNATVLPLYSITQGRLSFPIQLQSLQSTLIAIVPVPYDVLHATNMTVESLARDESGEQLIAHSTAGGTFQAQLQDGTLKTFTMDDPGQALELSNWTLVVDDWQPEDANGDFTSTKKIRHELQLQALQPWTLIPELLDTSGNATYSATFSTITEKNTTGYYVKFAKFNGSFRMKLNGISVPPLDQMELNFDISKWLKNGTNLIEVELASSLLNRMKATYPAVYSGLSSQSFGLTGVTIQPFSKAYLF